MKRRSTTTESQSLLQMASPATPASSSMEPQSKCTRLIFFAHGLAGSRHDFANLAAVTKELCHELGSGSTTHFHFSSCNTFFRGTADGIQAAGIRVAQELCAVADTMPALEELSLVGHSLGGMFLRYALYALDSNDLLKRIKCHHFVTIATPHLGIRRPLSSPLEWAWQSGASSLPGFRSAHELCLTESRPHGEPSLLFVMATDEAFLAPLRQFAIRRVYSNIWNDFQVSFSTAAIRSSNPYRSRHNTQRGAPTDGSEAYPNITAASLEAAAAQPSPMLVEPNITERVIGTHVGASSARPTAGLGGGFRRDAKRDELTAMVASLGDGDVTWERYDVLFQGHLAAFKAHEWIVGKNARSTGVCGASLDVCRHLGRTLAEPLKNTTTKEDIGNDRT